MSYDEMTVRAIEKVLKMKKYDLNMFLMTGIVKTSEFYIDDKILVKKALIILKSHPKDGHRLLSMAKDTGKWMIKNERKSYSLSKTKLHRCVERYESSYGEIKI